MYHPFPTFAKHMSQSGATNMAISQVKDTVSVNATTFVDQVYPAHGTRPVTKDEIVPVKVLKIYLIVTLCILSMIFLGLSILYCWLAKKEDPVVYDN